jgi:small subunit ribosomal protein S6e
MVEFKAVISEPKEGKSYQVEIKKHHANALIGKRIGDEIDGIYVGLPGYKLKITGGSDKDGFPMRKDLPGGLRKSILLSKSIGFHPPKKGRRKRKSVCGNQIASNTLQINMKVTKLGAKPVKELLETKKSEEE